MTPLEVGGALLATAQIRTLQLERYSNNIRVLCDNGAQVDVISAAGARRLGLRSAKSNAEVSGVDGRSTIRANGIATVGVCARNSTDVLITINLLVVPKVEMILPSNAITMPIAGELELADPTYTVPGKVELILGAASLAALLDEVTPIRQPDGCIALKTRLGWIVFGPSPTNKPTPSQLYTVLAEPTPSLEELLLRFWKCEDLGNQRRQSADERWCEEHFQRTCHRDGCGRYVVRLPLKTAAADLGSTREIAKKRFLFLERRLTSDSELREKYIAFMKELVQLNHMRKCTRAPTSEAPYSAPRRNQEVPGGLRCILQEQVRFVFE